MSYVKGLKCRECGREYPKEALFVCEYCFGSLEVDYEYLEIKKKLSREEMRRVKCWIDLNCPLWPDYIFRPSRPAHATKTARAK